MQKQPTTNQIDSLEKALYTMQRRADRLAETWTKQNGDPDDLHSWMFDAHTPSYSVAGAIAAQLNAISAACEEAMQYIDEYREEVGS
jgi:hypothetical protein